MAKTPHSDPQPRGERGGRGDHRQGSRGGSGRQSHHRGPNPRGQQGGSNQDRPTPEMEKLCQNIVLTRTPDRPLRADLFDGIAHAVAKAVGKESRSLNKPSQLRKFYDELLMWEDRVHGKGSEGATERLAECLPLIRMLNAKAAYAQGRNHVGAAFVHLLRRCLEQVEDDPETLRHARLFFEAFMGFYKVVRPKD